MDRLVVTGYKCDTVVHNTPLKGWWGDVPGLCEILSLLLHLRNAPRSQIEMFWRTLVCDDYNANGDNGRQPAHESTANLFKGIVLIGLAASASMSRPGDLESMHDLIKRLKIVR